MVHALEGVGVLPRWTLLALVAAPLLCSAGVAREEGKLPFGRPALLVPSESRVLRCAERTPLRFRMLLASASWRCWWWTWCVRWCLGGRDGEHPHGL